MECPQLPERPPRKGWMRRLQAVFEILLVSGLISSLVAALPLAVFLGKRTGLLLTDVRFMSIFLLVESGVTFVLLAILMKIHHENIRYLGLQWERWKVNSIMGLALIPFLFFINAVVSFVFRNYLPKYYTEYNPLTEIIHSPEQLALFIFSALIAGGIKEELQRAFILNKFRRYLGGAGVGLVLWSVAFGAGHYVQGIQGILIATVYGFLFGVLYLMSGSLIAPIVAHGAYDTLALLGYWLFTGRFK
jgi:membrane protease YdiL (CAAX protease family)